MRQKQLCENKLWEFLKTIIFKKFLNDFYIFASVCITQCGCCCQNVSEIYQISIYIENWTVFIPHKDSLGT